MENPAQSNLFLQPVRELPSTGLNTGVSPETEPDIQHASNRETPESRRDPPPLALIQFRIQQLHNRRFFLLKMRDFTKKAAQNNGTTEMTGEEGDEVCELEAIGKELEELLLKKEELEKEGKKRRAKGVHQGDSMFHRSEAPRGGIYMLPPPQLSWEDITLGQGVKPGPAAERPTDLIVPVDSLARTAALTRCPNCEEVVLTETHSRVEESVWIVCCLCSMIGCVGGCCLIPFFVDHLKSVHHLCPRCQAHIHTQQPF